MHSQEFKVFGIGLNKTGTSSLDRALNELGIRSIHFPCDRTTHAELARGNYQLSILERYQAITDIPVAPYYAQLDANYPHSKFILTVRDVEAWLESVRKHWEFAWRWAEHERHFKSFFEFITACVYGAHHFQRERFEYVYHQHLRNVAEYFHKRPHDLLILNICDGEGWEKLCPFLGKSIPNTPFPRDNRWEEKLERTGWIETLEQAVREFRAVVPQNEAYVLVDDDQLAGSGLDAPSQARRLIVHDGAPGGPPVDDAEAIEALEQQRQTGLRYLVIAWPSFWWLDHYAEFGASLRGRCRPLLENERLVIFDLASSAGN